LGVLLSSGSRDQRTIQRLGSEPDSPHMIPDSTTRFANLSTLREACKPEWLRIPSAALVSGLSRTHLFEAIALGKVESVHVRKPGREKGIRLIKFDSLMAYVESFGEAKAQ
jgi:hypothetical protein